MINKLIPTVVSQFLSSYLPPELKRCVTVENSILCSGRFHLQSDLSTVLWHTNLVEQTEMGKKCREQLGNDAQQFK